MHSDSTLSDRLVFTLLGTGSSGGVPRVGNQWGNCDPTNPKNRRRRCALLIERIRSDGSRTTVVIDAGVDLREQLLSANVSYLDSVILTHPHADHIFGLDDVRQLAIAHRCSINVYMDENTSSTVMSAFGYCFFQPPGSSYPPFCTEHRIVHDVPVNIVGAGGTISLQPLLVQHGDIHALGFRVAGVVYLPDIKTISDPQSLTALENMDVLIIDALRRKSHPTHLNLDESLAFIDRWKPRKAILTNMHSDLDYQTLQQTLPATIEPGYDGMTLDIPVPTGS